MATPERSRDASVAETATRDAMTTTTRAPFDPSELSREARDKMALLERRMTSVERSSGTRARGRGATRFAVEDGDRSDSRGPRVEDSEASSSSSVVARSRGTWRVTHTTAPPPSNGRLGPLVGESFQVIESEGARYRNVLSVPPNSWLAVTLRARYEVLDAEDASEDEVGRTWKVCFEDVGVRVFDRFEPVRKTFESEKTTRIWRTTYVDEDVRVVRAARTMEALDSERARGRNAKAGDEDDCLFVMTREVPWWELPA